MSLARVISWPESLKRTYSIVNSGTPARALELRNGVTRSMDWPAKREVGGRVMTVVVSTLMGWYWSLVVLAGGGGGVAKRMV